MSDTYRNKFIGKDKAKKYDDLEYSKHSYGEILWDIEKCQLLDFLKEFRQSHSRIDYLDFASGTGRIISAVEGHVDSALGIEISSDMVEVAQKKLSVGKMLCEDITTNSTFIESKYDLITAFRFFLNAEPDLQRKAMRCLAARLKNDSSRIIFNNHGNLWSHKILMWPLHAVLNISKPSRRAGHYMNNRQARKIADESGLVIERVMGCGLLSSKARFILPFEKLSSVEHRLSKMSSLPRFGVNQMYIARLKK